MAACSPILRHQTTFSRRHSRRPKETTAPLFPAMPKPDSPCRANVQQSGGEVRALPVPALLPPGLVPCPSTSLGVCDGHASGLIGIARLAASSPPAPTRRRSGQEPEYFLLPVRSILNRCDSPRVPFEWTVNPYRGCEFGCRYCYARYTHEFMELDPAEFERKIFVKQEAGPLMARDLSLHFKLLSSNLQPPEHIAIGTATDPYQPAEREFGVTRAILEPIAAREGLSVSITTKSDQVVRDIDLLQRIAARSSLSINITVTTLRPRLARLLEPRAPRPDLRLAAVKKLRDAGLSTGVFAMPVLPGLTDRETDLDALARATRDAGAQWLGGQVLFLMPTAQKSFYPFLEEKFPKLARDYRRWYAHAAYAPENYRREISARFAQLRKKYGLSSRPYAPDHIAASHSVAPSQLSLALSKDPAAEAVSARSLLAFQNCA